MSLKKKAINGLVWAFISQGGKLLSQFLVTTALARLLSPADFGFVGMATVFAGFVAVFNDFGVTRALIQKQDINEKHLSSAFWLNVAVGFCLMCFFAASSSLIASFYNKPELKPVLIVMSLNFVFASFVIVQQTILMKKMDFRILAIRDIVAVIVAGIVGICFALNGYGAWSLIFQLLTYTLANGLLLWVFSEWRPKFLFSFTAIKDIFYYSINSAGFNIVNYLARNVDYLLIGKFLGAQALGYYTLAYKLMLMPLQNVSSIIVKVMFPAISTIQDNLEKVRKAYIKMIKYISLITFPMMFGLFIIAPEFIVVIYGPKWEPVIFLIRVLCICGMLQSIYTTTGTIIFSQGKPQILFKLSLLNVLFVTAAILIGLRWGIYGVAIFYTAEQIVWVVYIQYISNSLIQLDFRTFITPLFRNILLSIPVVGAISLLRALISVRSATSFALSIVVGVVTYAIMLIKYAKKDIKSLA